MKRALYLTSFVACLAVSRVGVAVAGVELTDIQSYSDNGGVWNNDNGQNWAIWMSSGSPTQFAHPADGSNYLNNNGGSGNLPNTPVTIPDGTTSYALYRANYASTDVSDNFIFGSRTLTISPNLPYIPSSSTPATGSAGPIWVGGELVSISGFGWYAPGAYNINNVSQSQGLGPDPNGNNLVGVVTFTVTPTPEPGSMVLWGLGAAGLLLASRLRRKA